MFLSVTSVLTMTTRHKDSITNVSIFRVISFNAFLKLDRKFVMGYLGLNFCPGIWFLNFFFLFEAVALGIFGFWLLRPIDHPCHLKSGEPPWGKTSGRKTRKPTTNSTHMWRRRRDLNPGHIGGRRALSPLCHPSAPWRWLRHEKHGSLHTNYHQYRIFLTNMKCYNKTYNTIIICTFTLIKTLILKNFDE